jgi:hypothetical protein
MPYVSIVTTPEFDMDDYRLVGSFIGKLSGVDGLLLEVAASAGGSLFTVSVWESQEQAGRYQADRLAPAFQAAGLNAADIVGRSTITAFEADDVDILYPLTAWVPQLQSAIADEFAV